MIREDVFSIKVWNSFIGGWCHEFMTKDRELAMQKKREIENDHSLGMNHIVKLVHPADWVVDAFIAAGNTFGTQTHNFVGR